MRYLLIGINILLLFLHNSCKKTDYQVKSKWIYINETKHYITYNPDFWSIFNVNPYDTIVYYQDDDGSKNVTESDFVPPINALIIFYDNVKCDSLKRGEKPNLGNGPLGINNYVSRKLEDRYFEFTYRFTEKQYNDSKVCK